MTETRWLSLHEINSCNEAIDIEVLDEPGPGGAHHVYEIGTPKGDVRLEFQNGPIAEVGVNGITNEALLAIVIDRMQGFQKGPFACRENALALTKLEEALHWLDHRTRGREERGVEGTNEP